MGDPPAFAPPLSRSYLQRPLRLQSPEQQSPLAEQLAFLGEQAQAGSPAQSGSAQSVKSSQSLSIPSVQLVSVLGGVPQSDGQLHWSSPRSQEPFPQTGGEPQSISQLKPFSVPSQDPSPQQDERTG